MEKDKETKFARLRSIIIISIVVMLTVLNCAEKPAEKFEELNQRDDNTPEKLSLNDKRK